MAFIRLDQGTHIIEAHSGAAMVLRTEGDVMSESVSRVRIGTVLLNGETVTVPEGGSVSLEV